MGSKYQRRQSTVVRIITLTYDAHIVSFVSSAHLFYVDRFGEGLEAAVQTQTLGDVAQEEAQLPQHVLLLLLQTEALLL